MFGEKCASKNDSPLGSELVQLTEEKTFGWKTRSGTSYGVTDASGEVVFKKNRLTGKIAPEMYPTKKAAQQVADYYNK